MTLRVDVSQNRYKEGGGLPLRDQLPTAGLTELQREEGRRWKEGGEKVRAMTVLSKEKTWTWGQREDN